MQYIYIIDHKVKFIFAEKLLVRLDDGKKVRIRTSAAFCLLLLIKNHGALVTHDELYKFSWERFGMTPSLNVLHSTMFYLRKVLNKAGGFDNGIIETIHRRGFVFTLQVSVTANYNNMDTPEEEKMMQAEEHTQNSDKVENFLFPAESEMAEKQDIEAPHAMTEQGSPLEKSHHASWQAGETESGNTNSEMKSIGDTSSSPGLIQTEEVATSHLSSFKTSGNLADPAVKMRTVIFPSWRYIFLISILMIVACSLIIFSAESPANYIYMRKTGACEVYQNNRAYDFKNLKLVDYLNRSCKEPRFLYLTKYPYTNKVSMINCKEKISLFSDDICFSNYFIYKDTGYNYD